MYTERLNAFPKQFINQIRRLLLSVAYYNYRSSLVTFLMELLPLVISAIEISNDPIQTGLSCGRFRIVKKEQV